MNLITVSREYGAGGGEVASRLATALGWDLLDHELLHRAAQLEHLPDAELEALDEQAINLSDPLEYYLTVNSGRLGPTSVDLVALAAERFWDRTDRV
jgi:hypothetical protein